MFNKDFIRARLFSSCHFVRLVGGCPLSGPVSIGDTDDSLWPEMSRGRKATVSADRPTGLRPEPTDATADEVPRGGNAATPPSADRRLSSINGVVCIRRDRRSAKIHTLRPAGGHPIGISIPSSTTAIRTGEGGVFAQTNGTLGPRYRTENVVYRVLEKAGNIFVCLVFFPSSLETRNAYILLTIAILSRD